MKEKGRKMGLKLLVLGLLLLFVPVLAFAQDYPTKSVTITTTFGPGTPIDLVNRVLASRVEKILGQPFIINNSPPGGGMVATSKVAKEQPDGYQLLFTTTTTLLWIPQFRKANFSYEDFVPIMQFGIPAVGLVVRSDAPYKTLKELVEYAIEGRCNALEQRAGGAEPP